MNIVAFEDSGVSQLSPITLGRPAYAISCASFRLIDWLDEMSLGLSAVVRPHLKTLQLHDYPHFDQQLNADSKFTMLVNARMVPTPENISRLKSLIEKSPDPNQVSICRSGWAIAAAIVPTNLAEKVDGDKVDCWANQLDQLIQANDDVQKVEITELELDLFEYPHEVIGQHMSACGNALAYRLNASVGRYKEIKNNVFVAKDGEVSISDQAAFDTSDGPIIFESGVKVGPFCFFRGPVYVGRNSKISEHSSIKDSVSIGHTCKVGGEVEGVTVEPYSNKQHFGFLGHSYLGSWINLGAGTCNSDLKNTYGTVNMQYGDRKVSTGMQFVGCVMGDYAKTAINTSIFTGKLVGVGSMIYGFATANVPSFVNYARSFDQIGQLPAEVVVSTQKRMFARRGVTQRPCDIQLIHDMFRLTASERDVEWDSEPLSF